jgi:hypothetical protein
MTWLSEMGLPSGKRSKLYRVFYGSNGPANGTGIFLPVDQGLEHGPRDFLDNPDAADTRYLFKLAKEGNFSALVLQVGQVSKFAWEFAGEVPLIVKVNGKTEIPSDDEAFSPVQCSVEEAARLGADAIGYTMYTGSPRQDDDFIQFRDVREAAEALGLPVIVWAYPRGAAVNEKGGKESLYQVSYSARIAAEPVERRAEAVRHVGLVGHRCCAPRYPVRSAHADPHLWRIERRRRRDHRKGAHELRSRRERSHLRTQHVPEAARGSGCFMRAASRARIEVSVVGSDRDLKDAPCGASLLSAGCVPGRVQRRQQLGHAPRACAGPHNGVERSHRMVALIGSV